jgi:dienelactone hydrolase
MKASGREKAVFRPLPLVLCVLAGAALGACRAERFASRDLHFESTDSFTVGATLYTPEASHPPGLILLHMAGATRASWRSFAELARSSGYLSIAIDLRGHGETKTSGEGRANPSAFEAADWLAVLDDVARAKQILLDAGADPERLAVVGASIGANLALHYAASDPQIQAVVLLSPGEEYRDVGILNAMERFHGRPLMMMAARDDVYSAKSVQKLDEMAKEFCEVRLYPGAAHGTDLLVAQALAGEQILLWLDQILGRSLSAAN